MSVVTSATLLLKPDKPAPLFTRICDAYLLQAAYSLYLSETVCESQPPSGLPEGIKVAEFVQILADAYQITVVFSQLRKCYLASTAQGRVWQRARNANDACLQAFIALKLG
jgi:hypothetical protein